MRALSIFRFDIKFQIRHGFYTAYGLLAAVYIIILLNLSPGIRSWATVYFVLTDTSVLGFFFVGGIVLLERRQGILNNLFVTPIRPAEYLLSKVLTLTFLAILVSLILFLAGIRQQQGVLEFLAGIFFTSFFFTVIGIAVAAQSNTINGYFFRGVLYTIGFLVPVIGYVIAPDNSVLLIFPVNAALTLMDTVIRYRPPGMLMGAAGSLLLWNIAAVIFTYKWFDKFVIRKIGTES